MRFAAGCDDAAVSIIVGLVDDSVTEYESSSVRRFADFDAYDEHDVNGHIQRPDQQ